MFAALPAQKSKDHVHMWLEILRFFGLQACLPLLSVLKQLKYFWNLPQSHVAILLERLAEQLMPEHAAPFQSLQHDLAQEQDCVVAIKDPCCPCGYIVKNCLFSTNGSQ
jgi:hypothetical protein